MDKRQSSHSFGRYMMWLWCVHKEWNNQDNDKDFHRIEDYVTITVIIIAPIMGYSGLLIIRDRVRTGRYHDSKRIWYQSMRRMWASNYMYLSSPPWQIPSMHSPVKTDCGGAFRVHWTGWKGRFYFSMIMEWYWFMAIRIYRAAVPRWQRGQLP